MRILVIEDEQKLGKALQEGLEATVRGVGLVVMRAWPDLLRLGLSGSKARS